MSISIDERYAGKPILMSIVHYSGDNDWRLDDCQALLLQ